MLHVTNGTSVSLADTGLGGEVLVWLDVLHEGPVPSGISDDELRRLRGLFLDSEWHDVSAAAELARRDQALGEHEEVVLWVRTRPLRSAPAHSNSGSSPPLAGATQPDLRRALPRPMTGDELAALWPTRHAVAATEFELAAAAWRAFRSSDPMDVQALLAQDTSALPFLDGALRRHLQQFPAVENGLSRTERQILQVLSHRPHGFHTLFPAESAMEERIFMGDSSLMRYIRTMASCRAPLIREEVREEDGVYRITDTGAEVLAGRADHVRLNGMNRWLGGVHLIGNHSLWRWDEAAGILRRR